MPLESTCVTMIGHIDSNRNGPRSEISYILNRSTKHGLRHAAQACPSVYIYDFYHKSSRKPIVIRVNCQIAWHSRGIV